MISTVHDCSIFFIFFSPNTFTLKMYFYGSFVVVSITLLELCETVFICYCINSIITITFICSDICASSAIWFLSLQFLFSCFFLRIFHSCNGTGEDETTVALLLGFVYISFHLYISFSHYTAINYTPFLSLMTLKEDNSLSMPHLTKP